MKKFVAILTLSLITGFAVHAQEDENDKIRDKMTEFIQKRLDLSRNEAERFTPVFIRYFNDWRHTMREYKNDNLLRTQRIAELRIKYRPEFRGIVGDKRSNEIYRKQDEFIRILQEQVIRARRDNRINRKNIP